MNAFSWKTGVHVRPWKGWNIIFNTVNNVILVLNDHFQVEVSVCVNMIRLVLFYTQRFI